MPLMYFEDLAARKTNAHMLRFHAGCLPFKKTYSPAPSPSIGCRDKFPEFARAATAGVTASSMARTRKGRALIFCWLASRRYSAAAPASFAHRRHSCGVVGRLPYWLTTG